MGSTDADASENLAKNLGLGTPYSSHGLVRWNHCHIQITHKSYADQRCKTSRIDKCFDSNFGISKNNRDVNWTRVGYESLIEKSVSSPDKVVDIVGLV